MVAVKQLRSFQTGHLEEWWWRGNVHKDLPINVAYRDPYLSVEEGSFASTAIMAGQPSMVVVVIPKQSAFDLRSSHSQIGLLGFYIS